MPREASARAGKNEAPIPVGAATGADPCISRGGSRPAPQPTAPTGRRIAKPAAAGAETADPPLPPAQPRPALGHIRSYGGLGRGCWNVPCTTTGRAVPHIPLAATTAMSDFLDLHDDASARRVLYSAAALLIAVPFVQAGSQIWPLQLSNPQWRFGAANALSSILLLPYLGLSLLVLMAGGLKRRGLARSVGIVAATFTVGLLASLVVFALDALQLKAIVSTAMTASFTSTSVRVGLVTTVFLLAFAYLTAAGFKATRRTSASSRPRPMTSARESDAEVGLIVGLREG